MAFYDQKKYRGIALVIGIECFDTKVGQYNIDRAAGLEDIKIMKQMFERLDFFVMCYKDLKAQQIKDKIKDATQNPKNKDCECFVLALSTHGCETLDKKEHLWYHEVMGADRIKVMTNDILEMFEKKNAPYLAGTPKLFFLQACRSRDVPKTGPSEPDEDKGVIASLPEDANSAYHETHVPTGLFDDDNYSACDELYTAKDGWILDPDCWNQGQLSKKAGSQEGGKSSGGSGDSEDLPYIPVDLLSVKCPEDCLLYYPTMSGKAAFDYPNGSVMMQSLLKQFPKLLKGDNLKKYLTYVNRSIADWLVHFTERQWEIIGGKQQLVTDVRDLKVTASIVNRMHKNVKFVPKSSNSPMAKALSMYN